MSGINIYVFHSTFSEVNKIRTCFILTPQITYLWISENISPSVIFFSFRTPYLWKIGIPIVIHKLDLDVS